MSEYIEREAAVAKITELINQSGKYTDYECGADDACYIVNYIPAADVRPVVLCGVCELHGHCYTEDVFAFARLAEGNRFCAVGKVKTNGEKREES